MLSTSSLLSTLGSVPVILDNMPDHPVPFFSVYRHLTDIIISQLTYSFRASLSILCRPTSYYTTMPHLGLCRPVIKNILSLGLAFVFRILHSLCNQIKRSKTWTAKTSLCSLHRERFQQNVFFLNLHRINQFYVHKLYNVVDDNNNGNMEQPRCMQQTGINYYLFGILGVQYLS